MTEEKKGVSAWLRGIIDECGVSGTQSCTAIAKAFDIDCKHERTCRDCIAKMMTAIADRIDAERALPEGMEWPRFEDGELVRIGDELEFEGKTMLVCDATFYADGWALWCDREDMSGRLYGSYGERPARPAPKVLDADGVPIEVGDTVYGDDDPEQLVVDSFDGPGCVCVTLAKNPNGMLYTIEMSRLSHERPDSWERLEEDAVKRVCEYAGAKKSIADSARYSCLDCPYDEPGPHSDAGCNERMRSDIVRRAKALAKAGEVE